MLACWAVFACIALLLGRDVNWDLRNYHLYNAYALLEGRLWRDLAPANSQSFLHPGLDVPFYLMVRSGLNEWPRVVTALQAVYAGLLAFVTLLLVNLICNGRPGRITVTSVLVGAFGLTGVITVSEAGTTHNDLQPAALVAAGVLAVLCGPAAASGRARAALLVLGGVLGGAAMGFKLTAVIYAPGLAVVAFLASGPALRTRLGAAARVGCGGLLGFLAVYGPWGWFLQLRFGAPFGPHGNGVFRSPWFPAESLYDDRFLPRSVSEALVYPLLWAGKSIDLVTEAFVADPRYALAYLSGLLLLAGACFRPFRARLPERSVPVLGFLFVSYVPWLLSFGILRYAIAIEVLLGVPVWAALHLSLGRGRQPAIAGLMACLLLACQTLTIYPDWGRAGFGRSADGSPPAAVWASPPSLPANALVITLWGAVAYLAPFLRAPDLTLTSAPHESWAGSAGIVKAAKTLIDTHPGPVFALLESFEERAQELAREFGLSFERSACQPVPNNVMQPVYLCRVR